MILKNRYFLKNGWQFKLFPYLLVSIPIFLLSSTINEIFLPFYEFLSQFHGTALVIHIIEFYPFSVMASSILLLAQKRLIKPEHQKEFMK